MNRLQYKRGIIVKSLYPRKFVYNNGKSCTIYRSGHKEVFSQSSMMSFD